MSDLPIPADDFESVLEDYPIKLEHFEGPLDLLLFFIRRDEIDVHDIPIARIADEFLEAVRSCTRECDVLLIMDEVVSGFRIAWGGAQEYYGVEPDPAILEELEGNK